MQLLFRAVNKDIRHSDRTGSNVVFDFETGGSMLLTFQTEDAAESFLDGFNKIEMAIGMPEFGFTCIEVKD